MWKKATFLATAVAVAMCASIASAQTGTLLAGVDDITIDLVSQTPPVTGSYNNLFNGVEVWGLGYGGGILHIADGTEYYTAPLTGPANLVGDFSPDGGTTAQVIVGLAWADGSLYGSDTSNATSSPEGIYRVSPTGATTVVMDFAALGLNLDYDFGGLAYNPADGLFYGSNDDSSPNPQGLYSIDVFNDPTASGINLVAAYPNGETDIDGLAVGAGFAYLVDDDNSSPNSGPGLFYAYDLSQGAGGSFTPFEAPWTSAEVFSGGAWVPEPSSLTLLSLFGVAMLSVRRR